MWPYVTLAKDNDFSITRWMLSPNCGRAGPRKLLWMDKKACQRVVLDAALSPVQSRLLTYAVGVVDTPVSPVSATNLRCWLSERHFVQSQLILANPYKTFCRTSYFLLQENAVFFRDMIIRSHALSHRSENAHAFVRGRGPGENFFASG